ncbi:MAG: rRNA ((1915)-N(3))-methyltransferase RlmH [Candidatus Parcubacteria bacterium]
MNILVLAVGRIKEGYWREALAEYEKRLSLTAKMEIVEVAAEPTGATVTGTQSMTAEGARLLARIPDDAFVIALERTGKELSSVEFAGLLRDEGERGTRLVFIIGGAEGLDAPVLARAQRKLSMSKMTFVHEMARVILLEQIYRAGMILGGRAYHR